MLIPEYRIDDLKKLPLRAIVAFAVRCARRVEHLAAVPEEHPESGRLRSAVKDAFAMAEDFVRGRSWTDSEAIVGRMEASQHAARGEFARDRAIASVARAAHAAASARHSLELQAEPPEMHIFGSPNDRGPIARLADITADLAALEAFTAAVDASDALGYLDGFIKGATVDYHRLLDLNLGSYPQAGQPIDLSRKGPLGPLWSRREVEDDGFTSQ
jgi:hypothetical protein